LNILEGATLHIAKGSRLTVDGLCVDLLGMLGGSGLKNGGILKVKGQLSIRNVALRGIQNTGILVNEGRIYADSTVSNADEDWGQYADLGERVFLLPN